jgi:hypothetical protein
MAAIAQALAVVARPYHPRPFVPYFCIHIHKPLSNIFIPPPPPLSLYLSLFLTPVFFEFPS